MGAMRMVMLSTTGRKSGLERRSMIGAPFLEEDRVVLVASIGGQPNDPQWVHNLKADPTCVITWGGRRREMKARILSGDERDRVWDEVTSRYKPFLKYQAKTERLIPVIEFVPAS